MKAFKGTFTANVATGNQVISGIVDELGAAFTPKALLIWTSYGTTTGFLDGFNWNVAFTDGTNSANSCAIIQDNVSAAQSSSNQTTDLIAINTATSTAAVRKASFVSFGSGSFTLNWSVQDSVAAIFHYIAFGGTDLTASVKGPQSQIAQSQLLASVSPAAILAQTGRSVGGATGCFAWLSTAMTSAGVHPQALQSFAAQSSGNPTQYRKRQRSDRNVNEIGVNSGSDNYLGGQDSFGTFFDTIGTGSGAASFYLSLAGIKAFGNSGNAPTSNGSQAITGCGFAPKVVLLMFFGSAANTGIVNDLQFCLGAADRTRQGYTYTGGNNGVNPSQTVNKESTAAVVQSAIPNATAGSSTVTSEASITSLDADGFTLNWTTTDATARQYVWLALGDVSASGGGGGSSTFFGGA